MPVIAARPRFLARIVLGLALLIIALSGSGPAYAQIGSDRYAALVVDAQSGAVLQAANADEFRYPASLTKMMTIYMLFEALRDRRLSLSDLVPISSAAASMPPTKLGLMPGMSLTVEQALLGLVTKSANDAAAALGELMGGDEERFAQMMTLRARALGMSRTTFHNASGLPDWGQVTTARDLAVLARHLLQDFPSYYHYFSTPSFQFHGRTVFNHQRLLQTYPGADGLKTGYTEASGYNVVTSAARGDTRLIGVVLGAANGGERDLHMAALLDQGFQQVGVPTEFARREPGIRIPFIGVAHAASSRFVPPPAPLPVQVAEARPFHPRYGRAEDVRPARHPAEQRYSRFRPILERQPAAVVDPAAGRPARPASTRPASTRPASTRTAHTPGWARYRG